MDGSEDLSRRAIHGGSWLFFMRFLSRGLGFARSIILARLLTPTDFGLMGIALFAISTLESLSQTGFEAALIRKKGYSPSHMDTAWTLLALRGIILFLLLALAAPWIAVFFQAPPVELLMKVIAISVVLTGFRNIGVIYFQKELRYDRAFLYDMIGTLVDLTLSITLAFTMRNVWAIVWGGLAGNLARFLMSYILHPYRPRITWDTEKARELLGFGKWILGSGIIYSLLAQVDTITIGKLLSPADIGFYQMALTLAFLPSSEISYLLSQITFPVYSLMQEDMKRLQGAYTDVLRLTALVTIGIGGLIYIVTQEFVPLFLGPKWAPVVPCLQISVFAGTFTAIGRTAYPLFYALGKPKIETGLHCGFLVVLLALVYPLTQSYGIIGTSLTLTIAHAMLTLGSGYFLLRLTRWNCDLLWKAIAFPLASALVMVAACSLARHMSLSQILPVRFVILCSTALVTYSVGILFCDRFLGYGILALLKSKYNAVRMRKDQAAGPSQFP